MTRRRRRVWAIGVGVAALVAAAGGFAFLPAGAADVNAFDASAVTKRGTDKFADLAVTVTKTRSLINEVVEVTWTGGTPSTPAVSTMHRDFLQLMQCWGDAPGGPSPEQCQFGALIVNMDGAMANVGGRLVRSPIIPLDRAETHAPDSGGKAYVPFDPVEGDSVGGTFDETTPYFDISGSNEIPLAPTRGNGTGQEFFEVQTANEAPGLGCGSVVSAPGQPRKGRSCWLVVVPRSDTEVDGSVRRPLQGVQAPGDRLVTSPLSASNWKNRIVFPLEFQPLGGVCSQSKTQIPIVGHENATEAVTRWQPSLCSATGEVFSFSQLSDGAARGTLAGPDPGLSIVAGPLGAKPSSGDAVYAPIGVSGIGFAYLIEVKLPSADDPAEVQQRAGQRITDLRLTPRLVTKLLSQSYTQGVSVVPDAMKSNPPRLEDDKEFQDLNPQMKGINKVAANSVWTVITPLTPSDATLLVWRWIAADAEARSFLTGTADPHGMVVNPEWKAANLGADDFAALRTLDAFAKQDQTCKPPFTYTGGTGEITEGPLCPADAFPYSGDMHEAVLAANKGDSLSRNSWDAVGNPPTWKKGSLQPKGSRGIMVISDSATAARYNLPMAALRNASGQFVKPDPGNLLANVKALKPSSTPGVLTPDPNVKGAAAYPLTLVSYAATVPAALTAQERKAYAGFVFYAIGPGQKPGVDPGSLPAGYAPMPSSLVQTAKAAAAAIKNYKAPAPKPTPKPTPKPSSSGGGGGGGGGGSSGGGSGGGGSEAPASGETPPATTPTDTPLPEATPIPTGSVPFPTPAVSAPQSTGLTGAIPVGNTAQYSLLWLAALGLLAAFASRAVPRLRTGLGLGAPRTRPGSPNSAIGSPAPGREPADGWQAAAGQRGDHQEVVPAPKPRNTLSSDKARKDFR